MKASDFLGGDFIKGEDVKDGPKKVTITGVEVAKFEKNGKTERKLQIVVDDAGESKKVTLNTTNLTTIQDAYGNETDEWEGKKVVLYFDPSVTYGGKRIGGLRIKVPGQKAAVVPADDVFAETE